MARARLHRYVNALPAVLEASAVYFVRKGDGFDIFITNAAGSVTSYTMNMPRVFNAAGLAPNAKFYSTSVVTNAQGVWTADLTPAGFTAVPMVQPTALSKSGLITGQATATLQSRTALAASGAVTVPLGVLLLSGAAIQFAGAGYVVDVLAVGV